MCNCSLVEFTGETLLNFSRNLVSFVNSTHLKWYIYKSQTIDVLHTLWCYLHINFSRVSSFDTLDGSVLISALYFNGLWINISKFISLIWFTPWAKSKCYEHDLRCGHRWPWLLDTPNVSTSIWKTRILYWKKNLLFNCENFSLKGLFDLIYFDRKEKVLIWKVRNRMFIYIDIHTYTLKKCC